MKKIVYFINIIFMLIIICSCELGNTQNTNKGTKYAITFVAQNEILDLEVNEYTSGESLILPTYSKDGYEFLGWYTTPSFKGEKVTKITETDSGDKTFYAKLEEIETKEEKYTITFIANNKILDLGINEYIKGETVTLPTIKEDGYTFLGWYTTSSFEGNKVTKINETDTGNKTFYALLEEITVPEEKYSITFIVSGKEVDLKVNEYTKGETVTLPTIKEDGYTFLGWYTTSSFEGDKVTKITETDTGNKTFYAKLEKIVTQTYTLADALKDLNNYQYTFSYTDDDTSGDYSYTSVFEYMDNNIKYAYEYDGVNYIDYLIYENGTYSYYYQEDNNQYTIIPETDEYYEYNVLYIDCVYLEEIVPSNYTLENGKYVVNSNKLQEQADLILGGTLDGETYDSLVITLKDDRIFNITITSTVDSVEYGLYHATYSIDFDKFGQINFDKPNSDIITENFPIENVYNVSDNSTITVMGEIVGIVGNNYYISDGNYGVYIYCGSTSTAYSYGDVIKVKGTKTTYKGLVEISNIQSIGLVTDQTYNTTATTITSINDLSTYISMNINFNNLKIETLPTSITKDISFKVNDGNNTTTLFISQYLPSSYKNNVLNLINGLNVGDYINLENAVVSCYNDYQIALTINSTVTKGITEVKQTGISTNRSTIYVLKGTELEGAMENIIVYANYNNGNSETLEISDYAYQCDAYHSNVEDSYLVTISHNGFTTTITVVVGEKQNSGYIPEDGSVKVLNDVYGNFNITRGMPSVGDVKALVIPIAFTNYPAGPTVKNDLEVALFGTSEETGWESLSSYYYKASYGKLNITGTVLEPYNTGKTSTYYDNLYRRGTDADYLMIQSALEYYDSTVNYADYDLDSDGYIDALYIVYTAPVNYTDNDSMWWAYTYEYYTEDYEYYDGVEADFYFFAGYDFIFEEPACGINLKYNAETFIHETGHLLGLDDYYDYDENVGPSGGIGGSDMMDYNVGDHNPFSKMILGWTTPYVIINGSATIDLESFGSSGDCVIICDNFNGTYFDEYYVIDYYTPDGLNDFESGYSGLFSTDGIRIYHVDATLKTTEVNGIWEIYQYNNTDTTHKLISLIQASGSNSIEIENAYSSNSDLFKQGTSYQTSKWYNGSKMSFNVEVLTIKDGKATIEININ